MVKQLVATLVIVALGCAAPSVGEAADTCEARFAGHLGSVVSYSRVAESGDRTLRIDLCRAPENGKPAYDPEAISLQTDEYEWDPADGVWVLQGSPRTETGPCSTFTKDVNIGAVAFIEQLLCSESVPPEEERAIFQKVAHEAPLACWRCYHPSHTVFFGSSLRAVYCQTPDFSSNKRVHLDAYQFQQFIQHAGTYACPNIQGLTAAQARFLCGNPLPRLSTCGN